jgi:hypothetical protein
MSKYINDWTPETRSLLESLQKHGLQICSVDNGEYRMDFDQRDIELFLESCTACDEAWLTVRAPENKNKVIYLVFGNSPGELVSDYNVCPLIDAATDEHYNKWEGSKQPTKPAPIRLECVA